MQAHIGYSSWYLSAFFVVYGSPSSQVFICFAGIRLGHSGYRDGGGADESSAFHVWFVRFWAAAALIYVTEGTIRKRSAIFTILVVLSTWAPEKEKVGNTFERFGGEITLFAYLVDMIEIYINIGLGPR